MKPAIRIEKLSKLYRIGARRQGRYRTLRESIMEAAGAPWRGLRRLTAGRGTANGAEFPDTIWALHEVSLEIQPGEVVGIIGRNGAGKSTLLKILSRITEPTSGRVELRGRVGSLLEVGTGFHAELTGRENIYLNGSILGMTRRQIDRRFDEIVAFAEIDKFLDTPVKHYSSGMYVRLAFAVAAHLEPEVLLVDEVLAVGDLGFQKKCLGKMRDIGAGSRTVILVSHNMLAVESLCSRCLLFDEGRLQAEGDTRSVVARYQQLATETGSTDRALAHHPGRTKDSVPVLTGAVVTGEDESPTPTLAMGAPFSIRVSFARAGKPLKPFLGMVFKNDFGAAAFWATSRLGSVDRTVAALPGGTIVCRIDRLFLMPGTYWIDLYFGDEDKDLDTVHDALSFQVMPTDVLGTGKLPPTSAGPIFCPATWSVQDGSGQTTLLVRHD